MATLNDIAKKCNTSTATVSYVLNGQGDKRRISSAMQEKILSVADELGYTRTTRTSIKKQTHIAIFWPQRDMEMIMPSFINGLNASLMAETIPIITSIHPYEKGHIENQDKLWEPGSCDAAIIVSANEHDLNVLATNQTKVPTVLFSRTLENYSSVSINHQEAGELAANHAVQKGGSDIGLVLNPGFMFGLNLRSKAIMDTCKKHGVDLQDKIFLSGNEIDDGYELGLHLIRENKIPKVIICVFDMIAIGLMSAFNESGISIGSDVEIIVTNGGLPRLFARSTPPVTVVDLKTEEVTQRATKLAIDLATHRVTDLQQILIHPTMIYRQSSPMAIHLDNLK